MTGPPALPTEGRKCEACKVRPTDDDQVPGLCRDCAATIDTAHEDRRDRPCGRPATWT